MRQTDSLDREKESAASVRDLMSALHMSQGDVLKYINSRAAEGGEKSCRPEALTRWINSDDLQVRRAGGESLSVHVYYKCL